MKDDRVYTMLMTERVRWKEISAVQGVVSYSTPPLECDDAGKEDGSVEPLAAQSAFERATALKPHNPRTIPGISSGMET